jgi:cell wall-associated NlpC family hydrolase
MNVRKMQLFMSGAFVIVSGTLIPITAASASYNGVAAANYANSWAMSENTNYAYFSGDDCTNFVSQAMVNGTYPVTRGWWQTTSYFYNDTFNAYNGNYYLETTDGREESISATVAIDLYQNFQSSPDATYVGSYSYAADGAPPKYMPSKITKGDVLFFDWTGSGISHANMMVGSGTDSGGYVGDWIDQHSTDRFQEYWVMIETNPNWQQENIWYYHLS